MDGHEDRFDPFLALIFLDRVPGLQKETGGKETRP